MSRLRQIPDERALAAMPAARVGIVEIGDQEVAIGARDGPFGQRTCPARRTRVRTHRESSFGFSPRVMRVQVE